MDTSLALRTTLVLLFTLCTSAPLLHAQHEAGADSLRTHFSPDAVKEFDGFLLDMDLLRTARPVAPLPGKVELYDASKDYGSLFRLSPNATYSQGSFPAYGANAWGWGTSPTWQTGTFRLGNGMRIQTYGQYNREGHRVIDPSALPWQRQNFHGAFELKSANGHFGIRLEVKQGRQTPY